MKQEVVTPFKSGKLFSSAIATESIVFVSGQGGIRPAAWPGAVMPPSFRWPPSSSTALICLSARTA